MTVDEFFDKYEAKLAESMAKNAGQYMITDPKVVRQKMQASFIKSGGRSMGTINIDSPTFRALAREFGIKNTYKAWAQFIGDNVEYVHSGVDGGEKTL